MMTAHDTFFRTTLTIDSRRLDHSEKWFALVLLIDAVRVEVSLHADREAAERKAAERALRLVMESSKVDLGEDSFQMVEDFEAGDFDRVIGAFQRLVRRKSVFIQEVRRPHETSDE